MKPLPLNARPIPAAVAAYYKYLGATTYSWEKDGSILAANEGKPVRRWRATPDGLWCFVCDSVAAVKAKK